MPLVIASREKQSFFVKNEEWLGEILGHRDFDGYPFAVGDQVIFENGTIATIDYEPGEEFHVWSESSPTTVVDVLRVCRDLGADLPDGASNDWTFERLFVEFARMPDPRRQMFRRRWIRR